MPDNTATSGIHRTRLDHDVLRDLKLLVDAAHVEELVIRDDHGRTLMQVPVAADTDRETLGPVWAALGAVAAGGFYCTVEAKGLKANGPDKEWPAEPSVNADEER